MGFRRDEHNTSRKTAHDDRFPGSGYLKFPKDSHGKDYERGIGQDISDSNVDPETGLSWVSSSSERFIALGDHPAPLTRL